MKTTINLSDFQSAFYDADRKEQFSYEALGMLFEYFEQLEQDSGEEMELDVIAICCEYSEDSVANIVENYSILLPDDMNLSESCDFVCDWLSERTSVVGAVNDCTIVYAQF